MLEHGTLSPQPPSRVVVIGAAGFVGNAIAARAEQAGVETLRLSRRDVDLLASAAADRLAGFLRDGDSIVAASAIAPCKNFTQLQENLRLAGALIGAIRRVKAAQVVAIGSDAVFIDQTDPLTEESPKAPGSYHGVMHLAREVAFRAEITAPLAILRPTLIYGAKDPHGGYGPNQFRRKANRGEGIALFGEGEERRDHVLISDVSEIAWRVLLHRSTGDLNIASGAVISFREVASLAVHLSGQHAEIISTPRRGPMPHNGYRSFDVAATYAAFPDFRYTPLEYGMALAQKDEFPHG
jgi:nucleoside-diphosphate-sugar epimerase